MVTFVTPWGATAVLTTAAAPQMKVVNRYNVSGGGFSVALPALSSIADIGARTIIEKDRLDASSNAITVNRSGSDTFDDGSISFTITGSGQQEELQVVDIGGVKRWKRFSGGGGGSGDPAAAVHAATTKATPVDADEFGLVDSAASFGLKKWTWANIKAALQSITLPWAVGSLEVGHASDTTVTRMEAGLIGVEGVYVPTITGGKRMAVVTTLPGTPDPNTVYYVNDGGAPRVTTVTNSATPSINVDASDQAELLNLTNNISGFTFSGTARHGQKIILVLKSAATQTITAGSSIQNGPANMITATVAGEYHEIGLKYNLAILKWVVMFADSVGY